MGVIAELGSLGGFTRMTDSTSTIKSSNDGRSHWIPVYWSLGALFLSALLVPMFTYPMGGRTHAALPGTLASVATAGVCAWAFVACPRRHRIPKLVTFLLLLPALYIGFDCVSRYLMFGLSR